jgi:hypothetical protein
MSGSAARRHLDLRRAKVAKILSFSGTRGTALDSLCTNIASPPVFVPIDNVPRLIDGQTSRRTYPCFG